MKRCCECAHWWIDMGYYIRSDTTPDWVSHEAGRVWCDLGHWELENHDIRAAFCSAIRRAEQCEDFERAVLGAHEDHADEE